MSRLTMPLAKQPGGARLWSAVQQRYAGQGTMPVHRRGPFNGAEQAFHLMAPRAGAAPPGGNRWSSSSSSPPPPPPLDATFGKQHIARGIGRFTDLVFKEGKGSYITMTDGRRLLDWTTGIGVTNLGHCHPKVTKAAQAQVATLVHGQVNLAFHEKYLELIRALLPVMPHKSLDTFFFWNSGSEAVEAAVKLARMATKKQNIIVMQGSYHGRTMGTMAMTKSKTVYGENFGPLMVTLPFFLHIILAINRRMTYG